MATNQAHLASSRLDFDPASLDLPYQNAYPAHPPSPDTLTLDALPGAPRREG